MSANPRVVGILGGMGPEATVDLMRRIIVATPAGDDSDHIRMFVDNNPQVPSRIKALIEGTGPSPVPVLRQMAQSLTEQGADFLAMPCNTAHHYHAEIASAVTVPLLNIMDEVAARLRDQLDAGARVGLLASSALRGIALYEPALHGVGLQPVYPKEPTQDALMMLIREVKAGRHRSAGTAAFAGAVRNLEDQSVDALLIACTELSVIADAVTTDLPLIDSAQVLAEAVVAHATEHRRS